MLLEEKGGPKMRKSFSPDFMAKVRSLPVMISRESCEEKGSPSAWMEEGDSTTIFSLRDFGEPLNMRRST